MIAQAISRCLEAFVALISPSPSALVELAVNRRLAEHLSAREISQSPEVRCNGPVLVEGCGRSLIASPPFLLTHAVARLSLLHLQPGRAHAIFQRQSQRLAKIGYRT